jgi:hypothetical protein
MEIQYEVESNGETTYVLRWTGRGRREREEAELTNVFHKRAAHTSELRTPPNLLISNAFISTKTPLN